VAAGRFTEPTRQQQRASVAAAGAGEPLSVVERPLTAPPPSSSSRGGRRVRWHGHRLVRRPLRLFLAAVLTEIYLRDVCSWQAILRRSGHRLQAPAGAGRGGGAPAHRRVHNRVHGSNEQMRSAANFRAGTVWVGGIPRACAQAYSARQAFSSWMRSISTDIYLCRTWSCHEILRMETLGQAAVKQVPTRTPFSHRDLWCPLRCFGVGAEGRGARLPASGVS
jgi:hypothetical protein